MLSAITAAMNNTMKLKVFHTQDLDREKSLYIARSYYGFASKPASRGAVTCSSEYGVYGG